MHALSVAYNWDIRLLDEIKKVKYPVKDLYASAHHTIIGGGRPSSVLPKKTGAEIEDQIKEIHKHGIEFTYTLNAPCMGGQEFVDESHLKMINELQWIQDIGCDGVVLTIPYLMELVKEQFPKLKIRVSTIAKVNSVNKAKYFEKLGVHGITPDVMINRDFKLLEHMVKATKCEISLLLTDGCLYECPYRMYHYTLCGHASQTLGNQEAFADYPVIRCRMEKLTHPEEIMKCRWIRPEDIVHYEKIGIHLFKIGGRRLSTEKLLESIKAYSDKRYDGNLADIVEGFTFDTGGFHDLGDEATEGRPNLRIDNNKLDGFIDFFKTQDCAANCYNCNYCADWAKKAVSMNKIGSDVFLFTMESIRRGLVTSRGIGLDDGKHHELHARKRARL